MGGGLESLVAVDGVGGGDFIEQFFGHDDRGYLICGKAFVS